MQPGSCEKFIGLSRKKLVKKVYKLSIKLHQTSKFIRKSLTLDKLHVQVFYEPYKLRQLYSKNNESYSKKLTQSWTK